jgi:hypothetical protein
MEASARRVRAERDRRRLPPRRTLYRWTRRITGVLATAAFLGVGVAAYKMIAPEHEAGSAALNLAPTPAATHHKAIHRPAHKPAGLTKAQKAARTAAVAELRRQGYTTPKASDYDPRATLRVMIGRPVGDAGGGSYAFFFAKRRFLGRDALSPTAKLRLAGHGRHNLTLAYGTCCPARTVKVRFRLENGSVHARDPIPDSYLRSVRR